MRRIVTPELLDELPPDDPRAIRSRGDLKRVNRLMGNARIIARPLAEADFRSVEGLPGVETKTVVELGAGDGTFLLEVAKQLGPMFGPVRAILVDQQALVTPETRRRLAAFTWQVETVQSDVFEWLTSHAAMRTDATIANLFLHHFVDERLATLLRGVAKQTDLFITAEPYRSRMAFAAASLMGFIGCNRVTIHDGRISVRAGFRDTELSDLWPPDADWRFTEGRAGRFTHAFVARRSLSVQRAA